MMSGAGLMKMNGEAFKVKPGDALLTRPGGWQGLVPEAGQTLVQFIVYQKQPLK